MIVLIPMILQLLVLMNLTVKTTPGISHTTRSDLRHRLGVHRDLESSTGPMAMRLKVMMSLCLPEKAQVPPR